MEARLRLPLSKSMSARALIMAALTPGATLPSGLAVCDDTDTLRACLQAPLTGEVNAGDGGTTIRFLTAYYASTPGADVVLDGSERLRQRPIGILVDALRKLGADITYAGREGYAPLAIKGRRLRGGELDMDGSVSSQFVSALIMIAPLMDEGLRIRLSGEVTSRPYITMTLRMMAARCVEGELYRDVVTVPHGEYSQSSLPIEGDWSAAAAWYEIEALAAGVVNIENLSDHSVQGDRRLADFFSRTGVNTDFEPEEGPGIELTANPDPDARPEMDFTDNPDLAPYIMVTCAMLGLPFHFTGLGNLAIKECDRLSALQAELLKIGVGIDISVPGTAVWDGRRVPVFELPEFDTHSDHRMAMCLAPIAVFIPGIVVRDAGVVSKSYPDFWEHLKSAGFSIETI